MNTATDLLLEKLASQFPADYMTRDEGQMEVYGRDWTRFFRSAPCAVVFPRRGEEVARTLSFCNEHGLAVVPSGGRTGLSGGAVAAEGELVLSLERLNQLSPVEPLGATLELGAGVTTQAVHEHARPLGLTWPIDLASKGSAHIGGNLATNAGGLRVIRYGHVRHWVTGLEVVTMNGDILRLGGSLQKNNTGPDLKQLFVGSEGILGVIVGATLKLAPLPRGSQVLFFSVAGIAQALELLRHARVEGRLPLLAFEFLTHSCLEAVCQVQGKATPVSVQGYAYVLIEVEVPGSEPDPRLDAWMEAVVEQGLVLDGVLAANARESAQLWSYREQITESLGHLGLMHKNDVSVPVPQLEVFITELERELAPRYPGTVHLFGHVGDGNVHVNVRKAREMKAETFLQGCRQVDQELYAMLQRLSGSIAAEHGIGLLKRDALGYSRTATEIEHMRALKRMFDPQGLLNPGKVLPSRPW